MSNPNLAIFSNIGSTFLTRTFASPYAIALGLGLTSSSYFFFGNVATHFYGVGGIVLDPKERAKLGIDTSKAVEMWAWFYETGAKHMAPTCLVGSLSLLFAAVQVPPSSFTDKPRMVRNSLFVISAMLLAPGLFTLAFIMPTNGRLQAHQRQIASGQKALTAGQELDAEHLMAKWKTLSIARTVMGGLGWLGAVAAYMTV